MLCCILIALLAPLGVSLASWRAQPAKADCCRSPVPWRTITLLAVGGGLLLALIAFSVLKSGPAFRTWPICTMFGLRDGKRN